MKKLLLGLAAITLSISVCTSCTKTCTCVATTTNKVLDPSWFGSQEEINVFETPVVTTATGPYKGNCSKQNQTATQTNGYFQQTIEVVCN